jgi:hypothetical protein
MSTPPSNGLDWNTALLRTLIVAAKLPPTMAPALAVNWNVVVLGMAFTINDPSA